MIAPVQPRLGTGNNRQLKAANQRKNLFGQESIRHDVRKVTERSDEQQTPPRHFGMWLEAAEIDAVFDHARLRSGEHFTVLLRHHYDTSESLHRAALVATPAPPIPPRAHCFVALHHLRVEVEGDVVLHQNIAAVGRQIGIFGLQQIRVAASQQPRHFGRPIFAHLGRRQRRPARLAIARLLHQQNTRRIREPARLRPRRRRFSLR